MRFSGAGVHLPGGLAIEPRQAKDDRPDQTEFRDCGPDPRLQSGSAGPGLSPPSFQTLRACSFAAAAAAVRAVASVAQ